MRKFVLLGVVALIGALLVNGCAKKQAVKTEEPAPPPAAAPAKPAEPSPAPPAGEQVVQPQPVEESRVPEGKAEEAPITEAAGLQAIYFDYDSFALSSQARDILAKNADILRNRKGVRIQLEGHTDERGSDEYNLALGEKRAAAAKNYLVTMGVPSNSLSVITYGEERPAVPGSDEQAWAKNRRVEFVIVK